MIRFLSYFFFVFLVSVDADAQVRSGPGGFFLGPPPIPMVVYTGSFSGTHHGSERADQHRLLVSVPVSASEGGIVSVSAMGSSLTFFERPVFLRAARRLDPDWGRYEGTLAYASRGGERHFGGRLSFGTASDSPFFSFREFTLNVIGYYGYDLSEQSRWIWTLFISNNSALENYVPIPGFIYSYQAGNFSGTFGVPLATMQWKFAPRWQWNLALFGLTMTTDVVYGPERGLQGFAFTSWVQQSFLRSRREFDRDRVFFDEKRAGVGLRTNIFSGLTGEVQAGYSFDRAVFEGPRFYQRHRGQHDLSDGGFVSFQLRMTPGTP